MAELVDAEKQAERLAEFGERIAKLRREGVATYPPLGAKRPWAETAEADKLWEIVWESWTVTRYGPAPGVAALAEIERNVDYAGLLPIQMEMLQDLRANLDAGQLDGQDARHKDRVATAVAGIVGIGQFEERLVSLKQDEDRPWAEVPEEMKVKILVEMAQVTDPPGEYTLSAIEREVDYANLSSWRREALEGLRSWLNRGDLNGENPNPAYEGDFAGYALRMAELEARIEDEKRLGALDGKGRRWPWRELSEEQKLDGILLEIGELQLGSDAGAFEVIYREVDMARVPEAQRRLIEKIREEPWADWEDDLRLTNNSPASANEVDEIPTFELRELFAELKHDYGLRRLEDHGVKYDDETERQLDDPAEAGERRLPSPSEIAGDSLPYALAIGPDRGNSR